MNKNNRLLQVLNRKRVDVTPVWMMRQAGRYLPEYRNIRAKAGSFMKLCQTPDLACEVTLQPIKRYPQLDAAILFSDILTVADALGLGLEFVEGEGPILLNPIRSECDIAKLPKLNSECDLSYVMNTIKMVKKELQNKVPLIGFAGSPWTLATYMCEGSSSRDFANIKTMLYNEPANLHQLLNHITDATINYLQAQIDSGVQVIQLFDSWGGVLEYGAYQEFSLAYMQKIIQKLNNQVPIILFSKGAGLNLPAMANSGAQAISLDWTCSLGYAQKIVGDKVVLQGNMDPVILKAKPCVIKQEVKRILQDFGYNEGHIFNLGHGITPDINPDNVAVFFDAVHEFSAKYHKN